jgi:hypothetical protein
VIDAGTAIEVALSAAIASDLHRAGLAPGFIDKAIKNANGVVGLGALYRDLVGPLSVSARTHYGVWKPRKRNSPRLLRQITPLELVDAVP